MLFGFRYSFLLVDETITTQTETLKLLNQPTDNVTSIMKWWSDRWQGQMGSSKESCVLILILSHGIPHEISHETSHEIRTKKTSQDMRHT